MGPMAKLAAEMRAEQERLGSLQPRDFHRPADTRLPGAWQVAPDDERAEPEVSGWNWAELIAENAPAAAPAVPPPRSPAQRSSSWTLTVAAGLLGAFIGAAGAWLVTGATPFDPGDKDSAPVASPPARLGQPPGVAPVGGRQQSGVSPDASPLVAGSLEVTPVPASAGFPAQLANALSPSMLTRPHQLPHSAVRAAVDTPSPPAVKAKPEKSAAKVPRPKPRPAEPLVTARFAPATTLELEPEPVEPFTPPAAMIARDLILKAERDDR